jgi:hypothetical protein
MAGVKVNRTSYSVCGEIRRKVEEQNWNGRIILNGSLWKRSSCLNCQINYTYWVEHNTGLFKIELRNYMYLYATFFGPVAHM